MFLKQGDLSPALVADLNADLSGAAVLLKMRRLGTTVEISKTATITDAPNGLVSYQWVSGDTDAVGTYFAEFRVTYAGGAIQRFPARSYLEVVVVPKVA